MKQNQISKPAMKETRRKNKIQSTSKIRNNLTLFFRSAFSKKWESLAVYLHLAIIVHEI